MKILIGIPCMESIPVETVESILKLKKPCQCDIKFIPNSLVYVARDRLVRMAVNQCYDYLLFIDSDMTFEPNALIKALEHDEDVVSGLYFKRKGNHAPVVYSDVQMRFTDSPKAETITHFEDDFFEIKGCGMGFCLIKVDLLQKLLEKCPSCFECLQGLGEDLSFCYRVTKLLDKKMFCDATIEIGHIGKTIITREDWKDGE